MADARGVIVGFPPDDSPRVAIATPYYSSIEPDTENCIRALERASFAGGVPCTTVRKEGTYVEKVRNELVDYVLKLDMRERPTHILWVDADQTFHEQSLLRLLGHQIPFVGGFYRRRADDGAPVIGRRNKHGIWETTKLWADMRESIDNGEYLFDDGLEQVGTGFLLTDIRVYERLERPWFRVVDDDPDPNRHYGEDTYFTIKAQEAGFQPAIDLGCEVGHIGKKIYEVDEFWRQFQRWQKDREGTNAA